MFDLLYHPTENPTGWLIEDLLTKTIAELEEKQRRGGREIVGARESAIVKTKLEEALLWQEKRMKISGAPRPETARTL